MKRIQSKLHRIGTYDICEIFLSCFDDKRYILGDDINSLDIIRHNRHRHIRLIDIRSQ